MKKIFLGKHKVEIFDTIEELPITRFHKYNKMLLIDAGVGSDLEDYDKHIEKALIYLRENKNNLCADELQNMRQNIYFIQSNVSPRCLAFAALVKSIDGSECNDISDDGLKKIVEILGDATKKDLTAQFGAVKKKIDNELELYFPRLFDNSEVKEYYDKLRERTLIILQSIEAGETTDEMQDKIDNITDALITFFKPSSFAGRKNKEIEYDKQFENMCLILTKNLNADAKKYNVLEFYNAFEYLQEEIRQLKNKNAK